MNYFSHTKSEMSFGLTMKKHGIVVILCLFGFNVWAQYEFMNPSNAIPASPSTSAPKVFTPSVFSPKTPSTNKSSSIMEKNSMQFTNPNSFANPGDVYKDKLNRKPEGDDFRVYRKNQFLGEFTSKAETVRISCRDFGEIDGDEIRIWVNGKVMVERIFLTGDYRGIDLGLIKGFNKVDFEAINQGESGPNTADFQVYDEKGQLISANQWNLATGFKASIILIKD
ncbi:MAG: hypothetical protein RL699_1196 [Bacteroidota bacterium]|jgi:hypothetical protein